MKNKLWICLSILRDKNLPEWVREVIDYIRFTKFFKEQWWYDYE